MLKLIKSLFKKDTKKKKVKTTKRKKKQHSNKKVTKVISFEDSFFNQNLIDQYKGYDLNKSMLDQQITNQKQRNQLQNFIEDVIVLFLNRYNVTDKQGNSLLQFNPSIKTINYINDCFEHYLYSKKYKELLNLNILSRNELFSLILSIINKIVYDLSEQIGQEQDEDGKEQI